MSEVTRILEAVSKGDQKAAEELWPLVYEELRQVARRQMARERAEHTLEATSLVHEAYLRLLKDEDPSWECRGHFFAAAAEAMRRILIEHARAKNSIKRGGGRAALSLDDDPPPIASPCEDLGDLLALNDALDQFTQIDPEKAGLVKLLYFAGLSLQEAAAAQGISRATAYRRWQFARAWLHDAIAGSADRT